MIYLKETYMKKQLTPQHELQTTSRAAETRDFFVVRLPSFVWIVRTKRYDHLRRRDDEERKTPSQFGILTLITGICTKNRIIPQVCLISLEEICL